MSLAAAGTVSGIAGRGDGERFPAWILVLDEEDVQFLRRFLLSSGSLKDLAAEYGVSYPTVRSRLDRLIAKVKAAEDPRITDPLQRKRAHQDRGGFSSIHRRGRLVSASHPRGRSGLMGRSRMNSCCQR